MTLPRVVVIEDDETLGEFFSMVLELLPVEHRLCSSGEAALAALQRAPADVLVTDLLLPGLDGRGVLKALRANPQLRGPARLVVMSGSIDDAVRRELTQLGVWRVLSKPVTVKAFRACIEDALAANGSAAAGLQPAERAIIESHFAGNEELYRAYRSSSLQQIPRDIEQGDRALQTGDMAGMRRVAHNLKSVLRTLAREELAQIALDLENAAAAMATPTGAGRAPNAQPEPPASGITDGWASLRAGLLAIVDAVPGAH